MFYKMTTIRLDIKKIAEACRIDEDLLKDLFENGHYIRGILAAALSTKLNEEDPNWHYDVYQGEGEEILLTRKHKHKYIEEESPFYVRKPSDVTNYILADMRKFPIVCFYIRVP